MINGLEIISKTGGIGGHEALGLQIFGIGNVQIDAKNNFFLGFDVIRVACGDKQNGMHADFHISIGTFNEGAAVNAEGKGAVLPGRNDTVLGRKMELDYGQKVKMQ